MPLERPSIINIERSVAAGIQRASLGANTANEDYFASAYLTGPLFGAQNPTLLNGWRRGPIMTRNGTSVPSFLCRTVFRPNTNASGTPGVSRTTLAFGDQPEQWIDMNEEVTSRRADVLRQRATLEL